jgi:hypothetical protein
MSELYKINRRNESVTGCHKTFTTCLTNVKKEIHLGITEKARRFVLPSFKFQSLFAYPFNALIIILPRHWFFIQY